MYAIRWHYRSTLTLAATLAACEKQSVKRVQKCAEQAVQTTQDYADDVQKDFENSSKAVAGLSAKVQNIADDAVKQRLKMLIVQRDDLKASTDKMHSNTGGAWESMKKSVDAAIERLRTSYADAAKEMKK